MFHRTKSNSDCRFRSIGIRIGDDLQLQVAVRRRREQLDDTVMEDDSNERIVGGTKGIKFDPINLDEFWGTSTLQKFEMFISSLLHQEKQQ